jgi:hypothetical protein
MHEHHAIGLAQNNTQPYGYGQYQHPWGFEWSPFTECPPYDINNIGQNFGCAHPFKKLPSEVR